MPVEPDGSAYFEVPALRPVFFVALDANDMSVKRMQSFVQGRVDVYAADRAYWKSFWFQPEKAK